MVLSYVVSVGYVSFADLFLCSHYCVARRWFHMCVRRTLCCIQDVGSSTGAHCVCGTLRLHVLSPSHGCPRSVCFQACRTMFISGCNSCISQIQILPYRVRFMTRGCLTCEKTQGWVRYRRIPFTNIIPRFVFVRACVVPFWTLAHGDFEITAMQQLSGVQSSAQPLA